ATQQRRPRGCRCTAAENGSRGRKTKHQRQRFAHTSRIQVEVTASTLRVFLTYFASRMDIDRSVALRAWSSLILASLCRAFGVYFQMRGNGMRLFSNGLSVASRCRLTVARLHHADRSLRPRKADQERPVRLRAGDTLEAIAWH